MAETAEDFDAARALGWAWVDWQLKVFPEQREAILAYFEPTAYRRTLEELPTIHARPKGAVLLADLDGRVVGCVMYLEPEPGIAEVKRLFVEEIGRGHGIGQALLTEMFARMRADGYPRVRFSSARFLTHARKLYVSMGFAEIPAPPDAPPEAYFMERSL